MRLKTLIGALLVSRFPTSLVDSKETESSKPHGCEPCAISTELWTDIWTFLTKNGFSRYSILSEKSEIPGEKLEGKTGAVKATHMAADQMAVIICA